MFNTENDMSEIRKIGLQFFAEDSDGADDGGDDADGADDGASGKSGAASKKGSEGDSGASVGKEPKTYTQDEVNAMMAKEKRQGRAAALKELGVKDVNSAKSALEKYREFENSQKTEEQKAADAASAAEIAKQEAESRAIRAEAMVEAMKLDAKPDCVEDVITLAAGKVSEDKDFKTVISELKTKYPSLFVDSSGGDDSNGSKGKAGQKGTGGAMGNGSKSGGKEGEMSLGARLAAQRKGPATGKSQFFSK